MDSLLAEIIKSGKICGGDIGRKDVPLHLFIAALDRISPSLSSIIEPARLKERRAILWLANKEQYVDAKQVIVQDGVF
jgi:hypothetical protein